MKNVKILNRDRIHGTLSAVCQYPLTILEAPMGYGKTTAVKSYIEKEGLTPFWFTFSGLKNSNTAFWDRFTDDLARLDFKAASALKSLGFPMDAPHMEKFLLILGGIHFIENYIIILDDYQLAGNEHIHRLILRLAQEEPEGLSVLLITRDTTGLDFLELLSRGQCCLIRRQQLQFTESELRAYCLMRNENITEITFQKIWKYTDGWISFAYILLLGLEHGIPIDRNTTLEELIERALFQQYDSNIRDFLLKLSLTDDFTPMQAAFVTEQENASLLLKQLNKENAFIYYDEKNGIYKIHTVLLSFLRNKGHFSADELNRLYGRTGEFLLQKNDFLPAYRYLYLANRQEDILSHLNTPENIRDEWLDFEGADEMFNGTSRDMLFRYPFAYLLYIFYSILLGRTSPCLSWEERLDELEQYYIGREEPDIIYQNRVLGEILIVRKFTLFNHVDRMRASNAEITRLLRGQNSYITLQTNAFTFASPHYLYLYYRDRGSLKELSGLLSEEVGYAKFADGCGSGCESLAPAEYALETGDFERVASHCLKAIIRAENKSQEGVAICARFTLMRLHLAEGRTAEALKVLSQLEEKVKSPDGSAYNTTVDLCKGYLYASMGQPEYIPSWLQTGEIRASDFFSQGIAFNYIVYGKALLALGRYAELEARISQFDEYFSIFHNNLGFVHNRILEAAAHCHLYGKEAGALLLETALTEAQADWLVLPFAENAPHIMEMLQIILSRGKGSPFAEHILSLCKNYPGRPLQSQRLQTELSQRETAILSLAALGFSRKATAEQLYISEETVKTHLKKIYQKLGASSKVAAINLARVRGYLDGAN